MKRLSRPRAVGATVAIVVSALVLPIITNVLSDQLPAAWSRYAWLALPLAVILTVVLIALSSRSANDSAAAGGGVQINVAHGAGSTIHAAQHGDVRSSGDRTPPPQNGD